MDIELIEQLNGYFEGKDLKRGVALDAATALSTLQAENEKLRAELEQVKIERDAAVSDLEHIMSLGGNMDTCQLCGNAQCHKRGGTKLCLPKWRGQKED